MEKLVRLWTDDEVRSLRDGVAEGLDSVVMGLRLERTPRSVRSKAHRMGLRFLSANEWGPRDDATLREGLAAGDPIAIIARRLQRTHGATWARAYRMGIVDRRLAAVKSWGDPDVAQLRALAAAGYPASEIAHEMGRNRNSIIGAAWRRGIPITGGSPRPRARYYVATDGSNYHTATLTLPRTAAPTPPQTLPNPSGTSTGRVPLVKLKPHHCRWVTRTQRETGKPATFCARTKVPGEPYCPDHVRLVYR